MKTLEEHVAGIVIEFEDDIYTESSEEPVAMIKLSDGRSAQVTIKIETSGDAWLPLQDHIAEHNNEVK